MKKIIFTILLCLTFVFPLFAQRDNLLEDGRRWVTMGWTFGGYWDEYVKEILSLEGYSSVNNITINGDTIVNDTIYKKLYSTEGMHNADEFKDWNIPGRLTALIRCDNGKYLYRFINEALGREYKREYPYDFIGNEYLLFDENRIVGDTIPPGLEIISEVFDTIDSRYSDYSLKYWKVKDSNIETNYYDYFKYFNDIKWMQGVGCPTTLLPYVGREYDCLCGDVLLFCIAADGDTIYRNNRYWYPELTNIRKMPASEVSFSQHGGRCIITLPYDAAAWSATLYNSVGAAVARRLGEGSEIILPATSKGTHILVVNADGRVVKKKVFIK
jgi:hypothetical protein